MSTVLYPGTFNPIHNGHADLVQRASILFDNVILGIATSPQKDPSILALRVDLAKLALAHLDNVDVQGFHGLTVDFAKTIGASVILKGIRTVTDFEYEFQMLNMNRVLNPSLETIFLAPSVEFSYISSTLVRQIASYGGDISHFVHPAIEQAVKDGQIS
ncbi:MAG: pantetheine-phosphate adenylyltransferase [Pseudomonadales bacterium]|nr:pantetheine-phosphate adenylyltransferase [Pseudomonadales bacterium]